MMCYKVPKLRVIKGKISVFELGNERLKIHALSAIFLPLRGFVTETHIDFSLEISGS